MVLHSIVWYYMVLPSIVWYCVVFHGWYCVVLVTLLVYKGGWGYHGATPEKKIYAAPYMLIDEHLG